MARGLSKEYAKFRRSIMHRITRRVHNHPSPALKDCWGKLHDIVQEEITVTFKEAEEDALYPQGQ
jgi:hypothetical protein